MHTAAFLAKENWSRRLQKSICQHTFKKTQLCQNVIFEITGDDRHNFNSVWTSHIAYDNNYILYDDIFLLVSIIHYWRPLPCWHISQHVSSVCPRIQCRWLPKANYILSIFFNCQRFQANGKVNSFARMITAEEKILSAMVLPGRLPTI